MLLSKLWPIPRPNMEGTTPCIIMALNSIVSITQILGCAYRKCSASMLSIPGALPSFMPRTHLSTRSKDQIRIRAVAMQFGLKFQSQLSITFYMYAIGKTCLVKTFSKDSCNIRCIIEYIHQLVWQWFVCYLLYFSTFSKMTYTP